MKWTVAAKAEARKVRGLLGPEAETLEAWAFAEALEHALIRLLDHVEIVALEMPQPNIYTPRLVQLCAETRVTVAPSSPT